jgi:hypothetical protein
VGTTLGGELSEKVAERGDLQPPGSPARVQLARCQGEVDRTQAAAAAAAERVERLDAPIRARRHAQWQADLVQAADRRRRAALLERGDDPGPVFSVEAAAIHAELVMLEETAAAAEMALPSAHVAQRLAIEAVTAAIAKRSAAELDVIPMTW